MEPRFEINPLLGELIAASVVGALVPTQACLKDWLLRICESSAAPCLIRQLGALGEGIEVVSGMRLKDA